jgi:acyl carrier protein
MPSLAEAKVIACIAEVFENKGEAAPPLGPDTGLDASLGLDSLDFAELVVRLEACFGRDPFAQGVSERVATVAELARLYEDPSRQRAG